MEGTSGTPHLLTDVRFSVSRKGYDPDEVDNFLERVSAAVAQLQDKLRQAAAQAETADVRAKEATRSRDELQARVQQLEAELTSAREGAAASPAPTPARSPEEDVEQASTVLLMAQRTADAAIEEANVTARSTVADARTQATAMMSDAQQEADRLLAQARAEAESIVTRRRQTLAEEVRGLESVRDAVTSDLATLEAHAAEQRDAVQLAVSRLQGVLDDPAAFRVGGAPGLSGASADDVLVQDEDDPSTDDAGAGVASTSPEPEPQPEADHDADAGPTAVVVEADDVPEEPQVDAGPATDQVPAAVIFDDEATPAGPAPGSTSLFSAPAPTAGEGEDESPLGPPDDEADAAMRAFFEAEFDDDHGR